jgi:putative PEP-CTERM system histidine kinase
MGLIAAASYLSGGLFFLVLALLLVLRWRGRLQGRALLLACAASTLWCAAQALDLAQVVTVPTLVLYVLELVRGGAWLNVLLQLLTGSESERLPRHVRLLVHGVWIGAIVVSLVPLASGRALPEPAQILGPFLIALVGLVLVEQLYRNTTPERRWSVKHLCLGLGAVFAYDLYLYADGLLFRQLDPELWSARGAINATIVPLLAVAAARNPLWSLDLSLSRRLAFYTTALAAVGVYLLAMAAGGYYLRFYGGSWGAIAQIVFVFAAALMLLVGLFSGQVRAQWKVLLNKHFYRYRYDYREEWLRLIQILFAAHDKVPLPERAVQAVADLVDSPLAGLWLERGGVYVPAAGDLAGPDSPGVRAEAALARFLASDQAIIDVPEFRAGHARYRDLELPAWLLTEPRAWLVLPLLVESRLLGFILLARPRAMRTLDWEDFALLKTIGRQVAGVLAQHEAAQTIAETRQFEAYHRLTAFIMHDLKNLIAQQSLVVKNAARHKDNPQFVEDAIRTVDNSVQRMSRLLEQLRRGDAASPPRRTALRGVLEEVVASSAQRKPQATLEIADDSLEVLAAPERLALVLSHVINNAQEATAPNGWVRVFVRRESGRASIEVADNGCGMDEAFIRDRLVRPFDTTKGSTGMGIGAYQTREFVRACGGDVQVQSSPGKGTRFIIRLPLADAAASVVEAARSQGRLTGALS